MAGYDFATTYPDVTVPRGKVKDYLDQPAAEFMNDTTIDAMVLRSYNIVFLQTTIDVDNVVQVKDVIEAVATWHSYGGYMNSMGDNLQDTNKFEFMKKLNHYKSIAVGLGNILGVDVSGEKIRLDDYPLVFGGTGISVLKDSTYFDGAVDNV